jgi:hypothetical protein
MILIGIAFIVANMNIYFAEFDCIAILQVYLEQKGFDVNLLSVYNDPIYLKHHLKAEAHTTRGTASFILKKGIC